MLRVKLPHNHYDEEHLFDVVEEMKVLGPPTIIAAWSDQHEAWCALEGSHRLRAAYELDMIPYIIAVTRYEMLACGFNLDLDFDGTVAEFIERQYNCKTLEFDE